MSSPEEAAVAIWDMRRGMFAIDCPQADFDRLLAELTPIELRSMARWMRAHCELLRAGGVGYGGDGR